MSNLTDQLRELGDVAYFDLYEEMSFSEDDGPDLMQLAQERSYRVCALEFGKEQHYYASSHAWYFLAKLQWPGALEFCVAELSYLDHPECEDADILCSLLPFLIPLFGPPALPELAKMMALVETQAATMTQQPDSLSAHWCAMEAIEKIVEEYPESRQQALDIILPRLFVESPPYDMFYTAVVMSVVALVEPSAYDRIVELAMADEVDLSYTGSLTHIRCDLGLGSEDDYAEIKRDQKWMSDMFSERGMFDLSRRAYAATSSRNSPEKAAKKAAKKKRKQQRAAKKKNRKK